MSGTQIKNEKGLIDFLNKLFEIDPEEITYAYDSDNNEIISKVAEVEVPQSINLVSFVNKYFTNYESSGGYSNSIESFKYELVGEFNLVFEVDHINRVIKIFVERKC